MTWCRTVRACMRPAGRHNQQRCRPGQAGTGDTTRIVPSRAWSSEAGRSNILRRPSLAWHATQPASFRWLMLVLGDIGRHTLACKGQGQQGERLSRDSFLCFACFPSGPDVSQGRDATPLLGPRRSCLRLSAPRPRRRTADRGTSKAATKRSLWRPFRTCRARDVLQADRLLLKLASRSPRCETRENSLSPS